MCATQSVSSGLSDSLSGSLSNGLTINNVRDVPSPPVPSFLPSLLPSNDCVDSRQCAVWGEAGRGSIAVVEGEEVCMELGGGDDEGG